MARYDALLAQVAFRGKMRRLLVVGPPSSGNLKMHVVLKAREILHAFFDKDYLPTYNIITPLLRKRFADRPVYICTAG
jgi:hypothetical protein